MLLVFLASSHALFLNRAECTERTIFLDIPWVLKKRLEMMNIFVSQGAGAVQVQFYFIAYAYTAKSQSHYVDTKNTRSADVLTT